MKRLLSLSVFLMMALLSFAHDFETGGIYYNITSSSAPYTVKVTSGDTKYTGTVTIPKSVTNGGKTYSVTSIGSYAFQGCSGLTSVTIPNSVTSIGRYAFTGCSGLTSVTIPNSVTTIGNVAFGGCIGLTSVTIGNSVTEIGENAFKNCSGLTSVTIPNSVTEIGGSAFSSCSGLTSVIIGNSVTEIGEDAFYGCTSLTSVNVPNSVTTIGEYAFWNCSGLEKVIVPDIAAWCNISFGNYAANPLHYAKHIYSDENTEITDLVIPYGVTTICNSLFLGCSSLTSVTIGNSVTEIGGSAFYGCTSLTSVNVPNSVTEIGGSAFWNCSGLEKVIVPDIAAWCNIDLGDNPLHYAKHIYSDENTEITDLVIPYGVTTICNSLFLGCSSLTSVTIPNSVTEIGGSAFKNCSGLTSVTIPNSVTSIDSGAFYGCSGLTSVIIGNSVTEIGRYAFYGCTSLTSVNVPNSVTEIGGYAFYGCSGLTSVIIGNSVTEIGENAFYGCTSLTSVNVPNSVKSIGDYVFYGCSGLTSVTIGNSVASIGFYAFGDCYGLTSVTIGNSVTNIGYRVFEGCRSLASIVVEKGNTKFDSRNNCNAIIETASNTLIEGCNTTVIPNSVTSIGDFAFCCRYGLTSITIPNSVTSIGDFAFGDCYGLKGITSYIQEPFQTGYYCWVLVDTSIPLYVPAGTKEKYQSTGGWKDFTNIIEFGGERIEPLTEPQEVDVAVVPDQISLNGMVVGDTYYVLDAENCDGADSENGCVVINTTTTEEAINGIAGKDVSNASVKAAFKGIIFMVPAGTGTVSVNAETLGTSSLMVKIGSQAAQAFQLTERATVQIPYTVAEPTYVYIYAGTGTQAARSVGAARAAAAENSVKVYSYKWEPTDPTGINSVDNSQSAADNEAGDWYTIDGRKLSGKPAQKGIYIVNGRKVAVK